VLTWQCSVQAIKDKMAGLASQVEKQTGLPRATAPASRRAGVRAAPPLRSRADDPSPKNARRSNPGLCKRVQVRRFRPSTPRRSGTRLATQKSPTASPNGRARCEPAWCDGVHCSGVSINPAVCPLLSHFCCDRFSVFSFLLRPVARSATPRSGTRLPRRSTRCAAAPRDSA
jgi:hypothetical protein